MESLWRVLNSNLDYKLSEGMQISFLILSPSHTKSLLRKQSSRKMGAEKYSEMKERFGFSVTKMRQKRSVFLIDSIFLENNSFFFYKSCLVVAFTVGFFYNKYGENKKRNGFEKFNFIHSSNEQKQQQGCKFILKKCSELLSHVNISIKGPHSLQDLKVLCNQYNTQIWAFNSVLRNKCYLQYPEKFDPSRMPIYLYFNETETDIIHVDTILDISKFFTKSKPCIQCLTFRSNIRFHRCKLKIRPYCKDCNRILLAKGDYYNQNLEQLYCLKNVKQNENYTCIFCQKIITDLKCLQYHKSLCKIFENCSKCNKRAKKNGHICNTTRCLLCFESYTLQDITVADHVCNIKVPEPPRIFPRLAFFDCETRIEEKVDYSNLIPNIVVTLFENSYHENFSLITFCEKDLILDIDAKIIHNALEMSYLPKYYNRRIMNQKMSPFYKGRDSEKEGPAIELTDDNNELWKYLIPFKKELSDNCMYRFLRFFIRSYFRNTVFISHRGSRFDSLPLIAILLKFPSVKINVIHSGNAALCVEIKALNIRFIDFYRYCPSSLDKLCSQFDLKVKKSYFPYKFILKNNHNYVGKIPSYEEYWYECFDSLKKTKDKREYWLQKAERNCLWDFNTELYEYCKLDVFCLAQIGTYFLLILAFLKDLIYYSFF